jgi:hypothetical protein
MREEDVAYEELLFGQNRPLTHEAVFIPCRPEGKFENPSNLALELTGDRFLLAGQLILKSSLVT